MLLTDFQMIRPRYETKQEEGLDWLIEAHALAGGDVKEKLWHVGCKPEHIAKRGHMCPDFLHRDWEKMEVYPLQRQPTGAPLATRMEIYGREVEQIFEQYFPEGAPPPDDLIHVSCTGYVSPSGAQKIVSKRNWLNTTVTHAYHMGCYAAMPALRIGQGFLKSGKNRVDVVHTELCTLHSQPALHQVDQLVTQSLFADGFMKYSLLPSSPLPSFKVLALREEIVPQSTEAMTWNVAEWGFLMSLAKEVPVLITRHLKGYLERLGAPQNALYAVHPGGPKILMHVQKLLALSDEQMHFSYAILKEYGNMSSATLPHIWQRILKEAPPGTQVVSLAFGPGLSISGSVMECGC
jgi:predicted naringenin-chalcone synthase